MARILTSDINVRKTIMYGEYLSIVWPWITKFDVQVHLLKTLHRIPNIGRCDLYFLSSNLLHSNPNLSSSYIYCMPWAYQIWVWLYLFEIVYHDTSVGHGDLYSDVLPISNNVQCIASVLGLSNLMYGHSY